MFTTLTSLIHDEGGASMVEYGLLITLIAMVAFAAVKIVGTNLSSLYSSAGTSL
jgi:pilus assembly protein Flp/PilA